MEALKPNRRCLVLFARSPKAEEASKGIARSRHLFERMRRGLPRAAGRAGVDFIEIGTEPLKRSNERWLPQRGVTFGERLAGAFADVRSLGYEQVVAVPIDVPHLTAADVLRAFDQLSGSDHVLGPSPDGGVYLIGSRVDPADLLRGISWNTEQVFAQLLARAPESGVLRTLRDVDLRGDLELVLADRARLDTAIAGVIRVLLADAVRVVGTTRILQPRSGSPERAQGRAPPLAA